MVILHWPLPRPWWGFLGGSVVQHIPVKAGDVGLISGSGRSPGEGNGKPWERLLNGHRVSWVAVMVALQCKYTNNH